MGDDARLWKLSVQHRKFNFIGDTTWVKGRVSAKRQTEGRHEIMLDVWCENQRGMVTSPGSAVVLLPTLTGKAVELPKPARDDTVSLLAYEIEQMGLRD
jgi:hypothetical protein